MSPCLQLKAGVSVSWWLHILVNISVGCGSLWQLNLYSSKDRIFYMFFLSCFYYISNTVRSDVRLRSFKEVMCQLNRHWFSPNVFTLLKWWIGGWLYGNSWSYLASHLTSHFASLGEMWLRIPSKGSQSYLCYVGSLLYWYSSSE